MQNLPAKNAPVPFKRGGGGYYRKERGSSETQQPMNDGEQPDAGIPISGCVSKSPEKWWRWRDGWERMKVPESGIDGDWDGKVGKSVEDGEMDDAALPYKQGEGGGQYLFSISRNINVLSLPFNCSAPHY